MTRVPRVKNGRLYGWNLGYGNSPSFLNGFNLAWARWGQDFVTSDRTSFCEIEKAMRFLVRNGGNAMRVWVFTDPSSALRVKGIHVIGLHDRVIPNCQLLLEMALHYGVRIVLTLFNGAVERNLQICQMYGDIRTLPSLLENAIKPLAEALQGYESLVMWDVFNEIEAMIDTRTPADPGISRACSDSRYTHL